MKNLVISCFVMLVGCGVGLPIGLYIRNLQTQLDTIRELWHDAPAGFREGLRQYHPAEYAKWVAAMREGNE